MSAPVQSADARPISELFTRICELALLTRDGVGINRLPGAWSYTFSDRRRNEWQVATNGHREPVDSPIQPGCVIAPFQAHVYYNGWPFAVLDPYGRGVIGAGEGANEDSCIAALVDEIARLTLGRTP